MCFVFILEQAANLPIKRQMFGSYNCDEKCLLRGTNWVFKENSLSFSFKGLISLPLELVLSFEVVRSKADTQH
jgi:hypothetical protein